jgi:hypothetical protein
VNGRMWTRDALVLTRTFAVLRQVGGEDQADLLGACAVGGEHRQPADFRDGGRARAPHEHVELLGIVAGHRRVLRPRGSGVLLVEIGLQQRRPRDEWTEYTSDAPKLEPRVPVAGVVGRGDAPLTGSDR